MQSGVYLYVSAKMKLAATFSTHPVPHLFEVHSVTVENQLVDEQTFIQSQFVQVACTAGLRGLVFSRMSVTNFFICRMSVRGSLVISLCQKEAVRLFPVCQ